MDRVLEGRIDGQWAYSVWGGWAELPRRRTSACRVANGCNRTHTQHAAAAEKREKEKIHQCPVCEQKFDQTGNFKKHVSTVVSRSVCAPHLLLSDLLCCVLLCFPRNSTTRRRSTRVSFASIRPARHRTSKSTSADLKKHVSTVVSRSVCAPHLFLSDLLCCVLLCFPRNIKTRRRIAGASCVSRSSAGQGTSRATSSQW
jgi:hypothetical protein